MKTFTIAVIAGDGVGTEVIPQGKRALETAGKKHKVQRGGPRPAPFGATQPGEPQIEEQTGLMRRFARRFRRSHDQDRRLGQSVFAAGLGEPATTTGTGTAAITSTSTGPVAVSG
jgi:hypothetical protein